MSWIDYLKANRDTVAPGCATHQLIGWPMPHAPVFAVECVGEEGRCHVVSFPGPLLSKEDWERRELASEIAGHLLQPLMRAVGSR